MIKLTKVFGGLLGFLIGTWLWALITEGELDFPIRLTLIFVLLSLFFLFYQETRNS
jgi:hypothetical protein